MNLRADLFAGLFLLTLQQQLPAQSSTPDLSRQIADVMRQGPSGQAHLRFAHAKGIVCQGPFQASPDAAGYFAGRSFQWCERTCHGALFRRGARYIGSGQFAGRGSARNGHSIRERQRHRRHGDFTQWFHRR